MGSHSVTCHPPGATFPPLPQPKLVLDLVTREGCKAELTWLVAIYQNSLATKYCHHLRNDQAVSWLGNEPTTESHKFNVLTTTRRNHQISKRQDINMIFWLCWIIWFSKYQTCCATTDSTSSSIRLNSSKQAHAPADARPLKNCTIQCS